MGNLYEEWGNQETQVDTEEEIPLYSEPDRSFLSNKEILEKKTNFILKEMEDSYQKTGTGFENL